MNSSTQNSDEPLPGTFIGCPLDADRYALELMAELARIPRPGGRQAVHYWRRTYEAHKTGVQLPDQYLTPPISSSAIGPIFILFANTIGTPVTEPPGGWDRMRTYLDTHGFGWIALLGEPTFKDINQVPANQVPLTGTLFELFDALQREDPVDLRIIRVNDHDEQATESVDSQQKVWLERMLIELKRHRTILEIDEPAQFLSTVRSIARQALGLSYFDPFTEPLPGLEAISDEGLLFGRRDLVTRLGDRLTHQNEQATIVLGVSGTGKSSLLRAGLNEHLFPRYGSPKDPNLKAIHLEPLTIASLSPTRITSDAPRLSELHRMDSTDPLIGFARILSGDAAIPIDVQPRPSPLPHIPNPPSITGNQQSDLLAAIEWWQELAVNLNGPLVLILDQAERIDAIARRVARVREETSGKRCPPALSAGWWRFTALLSILANVFEPNALGKKAAFAAERLGHEHTVHCVFGLHRRKALELWPIERSRLPAPLDVPPLVERATLADIVEGTLTAYNLRIEPTLLQTITDEAANLASSYLTVRKPSPDTVFVLEETKQASVLPQLATTLGNIIEKWREHQKKGHEREDAAMFTLDAKTYTEVASVAKSIDTLGERAWNAWGIKLADHLQLDASRYFAAEQLRRHMTTNFEDLLRVLVDASEIERHDLAYLPRKGNAAKRHHLLISALKEHRLLVTTGARYWRLPHRSVLNHWCRAKGELEIIEPLLLSKSQARTIRDAELHLDPTPWPEPILNGLAPLALRWIGSGEGDDGTLRRWLDNRLVSQLDSSSVTLTSKSAIHRLPMEAILGHHEPLATTLVERCIHAKAPEPVIEELIVVCAQEGRHELVVRLLGEDPANASRRACARDSHDGQVALTMAAAHGHVETVRTLLNAGASTDQAEIQYPVDALILATEFGHETIINMLLDAGAQPDGCTPEAVMTPLFIASRDGHNGIVGKLIGSGACINREHLLTGDTPLNVAAREGHGEIVKSLLAAGAQPDSVAHSSQTFPLLSAAYSGDLTATLALIDFGATLQQQQKTTGDSAFSVAAGLGHVEVFIALLEAGVPPDEPNPQTDTTTLLLASERGHLEVVRYLIDRHAEPNRKDRHHGVTPLLAASRHGHDEVVDCLLRSGAKPDPQASVTGSFPLIIAAQEGHTETVRALLAAGAQSNRLCTESGDDALLRASQNGHIAIVTMLLNGCTDPAQHYSQTIDNALLAATIHGRTTIAELLLTYIVNVNKVDPDTKFTALCYASQDGHAEIVKMLIDTGADVSYPHPEPGADALFLAAGNNHVSVVDLLLSAGADPDRVDSSDGTFALLVATSYGVNQIIVEQLLRNGALVDRVQRQTGAFPLLLAAQEGYSEHVETLLAYRSDPNQIDHIDGGFPLVLAAQNGHIKVVDQLIKRGAIIDRSDYVEGTSALSASIEYRHHGVLERLIYAKADLNLRNPINGRTPLGIAVELGDLQSVQMLFNGGASPTVAIDSEGTTALMLAVESDQPALVQAIFAAGGTADELPLQLRQRCEELRVQSVEVVENSTNSDDLIVSTPPEISSESFPGKWLDLDTKQIQREHLDQIVSELFPIPDNAHIYHTKLSIVFPLGLSIRRFEIRSGQMLENHHSSLWLRPGGNYQPVLISSGFPLDALLIDYKDEGLTLSLKDHDELCAMAALVLTCADPPRHPLRVDADLPLPKGAPEPVFSYADDSWREWQVVPDVNGRYVQLPWIRERTLILGRIRVTETGIGSTIIEEEKRLCDDRDWQWPSKKPR